MFTTDGTGTPRRCASQTPSGSIDAATSDAASIFRGVDGTIIAEIRMMMVVQDRRPIVSTVGAVTQVVSIAFRIVFRIMNHRLASVFL